MKNQHHITGLELWSYFGGFIFLFQIVPVQNQVEGEVGLRETLSLTAARKGSGELTKTSCTSSLEHRIKSFFVIWTRGKVYSHVSSLGYALLMNGSHRVFADFGSSAPKTGRLEEAICWHLRQSSNCTELLSLSLWHTPTGKLRTAYFSTADRNNCNHRTRLEELRPLSDEICKGKQLQKGLFFKFKDKQKKPSSSFGERQATPMSIIHGI